MLKVFPDFQLLCVLLCCVHLYRHNSILFNIFRIHFCVCMHCIPHVHVLGVYVWEFAGNRKENPSFSQSLNLLLEDIIHISVICFFFSFVFRFRYTFNGIERELSWIIRKWFLSNIISIFFIFSVFDIFGTYQLFIWDIIFRFLFLLVCVCVSFDCCDWEKFFDEYINWCLKFRSIGR